MNGSAIPHSTESTSRSGIVARRPRPSNSRVPSPVQRIKMEVMADLHSISFSSIGDQELFSAIADFVGNSLPPGDRQQETYVVDFKQEWGEKALRVVAGFANTFGGVIVVGVSENAGRADQIIGVQSSKEIMTQIASSIASNITPTPDYEIAECAIPSDSGKRLAVIRVRPRNRIHFLLKGDRPVYIRNQDQAIPAPVAELRALIDRERFDAELGQLSVDPFSLLPADFKITRARDAGTIQERMRDRTDSQSFMQVIVQPSKVLTISLDYGFEEHFKNLVAANFSRFQEAVFGGVATEDDSRSRSAYLYKNYRSDLDHEAKWAVLSSGVIGFAASIGFSMSRLSWSLPDVTANIATTISLANAVLTAEGYYGEIEVLVNVEPGGGILLTDGSGFACLQRQDYYPRPWPIVIPQYKERPVHLRGSVTERLDFSQRFNNSKEALARMLNQLLRDMGYAADLNALRQAL